MTISSTGARIARAGHTLLMMVCLTLALPGHADLTDEVNLDVRATETPLGEILSDFDAQGVSIRLVPDERWAGWPVSGNLRGVSTGDALRRLLHDLNYVVRRDEDNTLTLRIVGQKNTNTASPPPMPSAREQVAENLESFAPDAPEMSGEPLENEVVYEGEPEDAGEPREDEVIFEGEPEMSGDPP